MFEVPSPSCAFPAAMTMAAANDPLCVRPPRVAAATSRPSAGPESPATNFGLSSGGNQSIEPVSWSMSPPSQTCEDGSEEISAGEERCRLFLRDHVVGHIYANSQL